jgi:adenylate cyclase class IV
MAEEIEVKCKVEDAGAFRKVLERIGARPVGRPTPGVPRGRAVVLGRVHEMNEVFDSAQGTFASREQLVRVRVERWGRKGRNDRDRQRVVLTFKDRALREGAEAAVLAGPHKIREEVEVEVAEAIDRGAALLGFQPGDYITKSYLQIYLEDCRRRGVTPGDMLFGRRGRKKLL